MALVAPVLWAPSADESRVRRASELWRSTASRLDCTLGDLAGTVALVRTEHEGPGTDAFARWWAGLAGPGGARLADVVVACRSIADALDAYADALADVRRALLEIATSVAASIAVGAGLAWATAGMSAAGAAATITALTLQATALGATFAVRAGAIARMVALHATIGALEGLATYAIVEPLRIAAFHPNDDPFGSFQPSEMAIAAAGGALVPGWKAARGARAAAPQLAIAPPLLRLDVSRRAPSDGLGLSWEVSWGKTSRLQRHFDDHAADFGSATPEAYADEAAAFLERGLADGLPLKVDEHGVIRLYEPSSNTFGSFNPTGATRTFFKPSAGEVYWEGQGGAPR